MKDLRRKVLVPVFQLSELATEDDPRAMKRVIKQGKGHPALTYHYRLTCDDETGRGFNYNLLPVVLDRNAVPWPLGTIYILSLLEAETMPVMTSYHSKAEDLGAFKEWLDTHDHPDELMYQFPKVKLRRTTYRYRGHLQHQIQAREASPTTAQRRMGTVIAFYRWLMDNNYFHPERPPWEIYVDRGGRRWVAEDEVADLPLAMQVKLLRAIQEKRVRKVGSVTEEPVDVRIICATHKNLRDLVDKGAFRQDLYYRLNVIELRMPPLRERSEDIAPLVAAVLRRLSGDTPPRLSAAALKALEFYSFPGNVRELENILERATALCSGDSIEVEDLQLGPEEIHDAGIEGRGSETLDEYLNRLERQAILEALQKAEGNRTAAARLLGVTFRSMRYRLERLGIE